jgi:hypothetical protein
VLETVSKAQPRLSKAVTRSDAKIRSVGFPISSERACQKGEAMPNTLRAPAHSNTYELTPDGIRVAFFYTKVDHRLLFRCWPAIQLPRHSSFEVPFEPRIDPWTLTSRPHA